MRIGIITLFPAMFEALQHGIPRIAQEKQQLELLFWNPRDFTQDRYQRVDDTPYGGGPGMVMMIEPLRAAIQAARTKLPTAQVIYLSPQGQVLQQMMVQTLAQAAEVIFLCGRYEGIDERLIGLEVDAEWSIGDYVVSGGELPAMVIIDAIARWLPGVLGDSDSAEQDSFAHGLLDHPHYTRPAEFEGLVVPEVLLSGNHAAIHRWRQKLALERTLTRRPELINESSLTTEQKTLLNEIKKSRV